MSLFFKLNVAGVGNENVAVCFFISLLCKYRVHNCLC